MSEKRKIENNILKRLFFIICIFMLFFGFVYVCIYSFDNNLKEDLDNVCKKFGFNESTNKVLVSTMIPNDCYRIECDGIVLSNKFCKFERCVYFDKWGDCQKFDSVLG